MKDAIKAAAAKLDNALDADWQEDGRPSLKRIHQLAGSTAITQDQLDDAVPDLKRVKPATADAAKAKVDAAKAKANEGKVSGDVANLAPAKVKVEDEAVARIKRASGIGKDAVDTPSKEEPFLEGVLVIATEQGYYGSKLRELGESFYFTGRKGKWMDIAKAEDRKLYAKERAASAAGDDRGANIDPTVKA